MVPGSPAVGSLLICATPIGNPGDITLRVLDALADADLVACEDTRRTGALLAQHGIRAQLVSLNEQSERAKAPALVARIAAGETVAVVSDAGTPLLSDPGYAPVRECIAAGLPVKVLPGASAALAALVASGLPCERFRFVGFLPRGQRELLAALDGPETQVAFESPRRLAASLAALAAQEPLRALVVCRELTKTHEETLRGSAQELAEHFARVEPLGEITLVAAGREPRRAELDTALAVLEELVAAGVKPRAGARAIARLTGLSANELYRARTAGL